MTVELKAQNHAQNQDRERVNNNRQPRIYPVTEGIQSAQTADVYKRYFNHFLDYIKIHDLQVLLDFSPKVIKQMLIDYILYLRDEKPGKKLTKSSIKVRLSAVLYFFQINYDDFNLTLRNFKIHLPSDDKEAVGEDRPYTKEEIAQVLQNGCNNDLRSKVVILLLCRSGLRRGAVSSLRIEDLISMEYKGQNVYKVQVYARTRDKYFSFMTVESSKAVKDYLDYRQRYGEKITDKSPLIREQFNIGDHLRIKNPRFVSDKTIEYLINQVVTRSGVRKPGVIHLSHGMRKFFVSQCESSPMKSLHVSMLSGHTTGIKKYYYKPKDMEVLEDLMTNAADALTISDEPRLKQENAELRKTQSDYLAELGELKEDFNEMKRLLVHLSKESQKQLVDEFYQQVGDKADIEWSCD
jgi:integrase